MVALLLLAVQPPGALLAHPVLASSRPCLSRGPVSRGSAAVMQAAPPAGFEWGAKDRESTADRLLKQLAAQAAFRDGVLKSVVNIAR